MISLIFLASASAIYRNDANSPAIIEQTRARLIEIDNALKPLFEKGLGSGDEAPAHLAQIERLEGEAKQLLAVKAAAERSHSLSQIPETERFLAEFNLSKSEGRDLSGFSIAALIRQASGDAPLEGLYKELHQEAQNEARGMGISLKGAAAPSAAVAFAKYRAATQSVTGTNLGSQFVQTDVRGDLTQLSSLLATPCVEQAGAFVLRGLTGNLTIPVIAPASAYVVKTENADADAIDFATTSKSMTPKRLPVSVAISDQLIMQVDNPSIDALILKLILERQAIVKDTYALSGSGTAPQPQGLLGTSGIGSITPATNGQAPTWAFMVELETLVANANAMGNVYLTNSKVRGKLRTTAQNGAASQWVWAQDNTLNGYRTVVSNVVPSTLTQGSSSLCSAVIFGDFSNLLLAYWGGLMVERPRDKASAIAGITNIVVTEFFDSLVMQPAAFAAMKDALTA